MSFSLKKGEKIGRGIRRIAMDQMDRAINEVGNPDLDEQERIHQARKRCKKLRALLRLVRPGLETVYGKENAFFRDEARKLGLLRDADALLESYDALLDHFAEKTDRQRFAPLKRKLTMRRKSLAEEERDIGEHLEAFASSLRQARERVDLWKIDNPVDALREGMVKTYRRGYKAMRACRDKPTDENLHQWRKRAKYLWYQMRLVRKVYPTLSKKFRKGCNRLGSILGDDHDLAVLAQTIEEESRFKENKRTAALLEILSRRRETLLEEAHHLGKKIYSLEPKQFRKLIKSVQY